MTGQYTYACSTAPKRYAETTAMRRSHALRCVLTVIVVATSILAPSESMSDSNLADHSKVRESMALLVQGHREQWTIAWLRPPTIECGPELGIDALTCPCSGFAYGEKGNAVLQRRRDGKLLETLSLDQFFESKQTVLPRWPPDRDLDILTSGEPNPSAQPMRRANVRLMRLVDYDHDGKQTEWFLRTSSDACHPVGVVIGTSSNRPYLHAFSSKREPQKPLYLGEGEWNEVLRNAGPIDILDWGCMDHGSPTELRLWLQGTPAGITGERRTFSCPPAHRKLLRVDPL